MNISEIDRGLATLIAACIAAIISIMTFFLTLFLIEKQKLEEPEGKRLKVLFSIFLIPYIS